MLQDKHENTCELKSHDLDSSQTPLIHFDDFGVDLTKDLKLDFNDLQLHLDLSLLTWK